MNRYMIAPLLATLVVFALVLHHQAQNSGSSSAVGASSHLASLGRHSRGESDLLPYEEAEQRILAQWPSLNPREVFSRRVPTQSLYATLWPDESSGVEHAETSFLCTLFINAIPAVADTNQNAEMMGVGKVQAASPHFPIHVDRETAKIRIFADSRWQSYATWRDMKVPEYRKLTGFGT